MPRLPPLKPYNNPDGLFYGDIFHDPYTFVRAEDFFLSLAGDGTKKYYTRPVSVSLVTGLDKPEVAEKGAMFSFDPPASGGTPTNFILIQFVRPRMWRIRFNPKVNSKNGYDTRNSRNVVNDHMVDLIKVLDDLEGCKWTVDIDEIDAYANADSGSIKGTHYRITSSIFDKDNNKIPEVVILVEKANFKITALRKLDYLKPGAAPLTPFFEPSTIVQPGDSQDDDVLKGNNYIQNAKSAFKVVWQTTHRPLRWRQFADQYTSIFTVEKPAAAQYMGFGEQGGQSLLKKSTFMNYFDYDNFTYNGVYGTGPLDEREPLYHSEPFWIEMNAHQHFKSKVGTFLDNLSQMCVDFGMTNKGKISTATRFGTMDHYVMAGDDIVEVIKLYTSIIGRSHLKPRFVLGYHQACYGPQFENKKGVLDTANAYRAKDFPIDGIHIDVDLQDQYKTFTTDPNNFPDVQGMFSQLRSMGIKCGTNITPVLSTNGGPHYNEALQKGYFMMERRKKNRFLNNDFTEASFNVGYQDVRYVVFNGGFRSRTYPGIVDKNNPNTQPPNTDDLYDFEQDYNNPNGNRIYHGGVAYGPFGMGTPGFYPDLFRKEVRIWWGQQYQDLFNKGLEFVWQDMTSPAIAPKYGDMKSFPFRLLVQGPSDENPDGVTAIELWHLYSYNLHKATYHGLNNLLGPNGEPHRAGKRNFIIGRGSFAGMSRYAGLWTGDNASTWDFLRISISQVLAAGFCGITITGVDCGGFETAFDGQQWADPELLMRFYGAFFLLPWFRNHYNGKQVERPNPITGGKSIMKKKLFQEPYKFTPLTNSQNYPALSGQTWLYGSVENVTRYLVQLRYTLLQLLYDTMFDNAFTGLPVARSLVITDGEDEALYTSASRFLNNQYMVGHDLLVAPVTDQQTDANGNITIPSNYADQTRFNLGKEVYLPKTSCWYDFNLLMQFKPSDNFYGTPLKTSHEPGSVDWRNDCIINGNTQYDNAQNPQYLPYITPMYVREGGIIPQINLRMFVPGRDLRPSTDGSGVSPDANQITIHVYPGRDNLYRMYLDDGESRNSAPTDTLEHQSKCHQAIHKKLNLGPAGSGGSTDPHHPTGDLLADDQYREILISQIWPTITRDAWDEKVDGQRTVTIATGRGKWDWAKVIERNDKTFNLVLWHAADVNASTIKSKVTIGGKEVDTPTPQYIAACHATVIQVPVQREQGQDIFSIDQSWNYNK